MGGCGGLLVPVLLALHAALVFGQNGPCQVWSNPNYNGRTSTFWKGRHALAGTRVGDGDASSLKVRNNFSVKVCVGPVENPDECLSLGPGQHVLPSQFDDKASSLQVERLVFERHGSFGDLISVPSLPIFAAQGPQGQVLYFKVCHSSPLADYSAPNVNTLFLG